MTSGTSAIVTFVREGAAVGSGVGGMTGDAGGAHPIARPAIAIQMATNFMGLRLRRTWMSLSLGRPAPERIG
ncbi:MAG: hypothetical protein NVSMB2_08940 [Chloroflexota bacterium]